MAFRLHEALCARGHVSRMLVRDKSSTDPNVSEVPVSPWRYRAARVRRLWEGVARRHVTSSASNFNVDADPCLEAASFFRLPREEVDVLCLHWIDGLVTARLIARLAAHYRCPIVWTLHDVEPLTGGCHYPLACRQYEQRCGRCPQLAAPGPRDRSRRVWERKRRYLSGLPIVFVSGSRQGAARVAASSLFGGRRCEVIPGSVDDRVFRPIDRRWARELLHLPADRPLILFGAAVLSDARKGFSLFAEAVRRVAARRAGGSPDGAPAVVLAGLGGEELARTLPCECRALGLLHDPLTLALAYQAADVYVCASRNDEGPIMIPQALMCGTPVVSFPTGLAVDLLASGRNGYLCATEDADCLAEGLERVLGSADYPALCRCAHDSAWQRHNPQACENAYIALLSACAGEPRRAAA